MKPLLEKLEKAKSQEGTFLSFMVFGMILILVFVIVAVPIAYVNDEIIDSLQNNLDISDDKNATIENLQNNTTGFFDQTVFFVIIAITIGILLIAIFGDFHPAGIAAFILVLIIFVILAGLMANVMDEVNSNDLLDEKSAEFTYTNAITGSVFPIFIFITGVVAGIILLAKRGRTTSAA